MNKYKLLCLEGKNKGEEFFPLEGETFIGRGKDCGIVIQDNSISRKHAKLLISEGNLMISDNASKNATYINGKKVKESRIKSGDKIKLGDTVLVFQISAVKEVVQSGIPPSSVRSTSCGPKSCELAGTGGQPERDFSQTIIMPMSELKLSLSKGADNDISGGGSKEFAVNLKQELDKIEVSPLEKKISRNLHLIHGVSKLFGQTYRMEELLEKISDIILEILQVNRVVILRKREGLFVHERVKTSGQESHGLEVKISQTILNKSIEEKAGIITGDAVNDERFQGSESVIAQKIHSAMCVPLMAQDSILGVLYVDSNQRINMFTETELSTLAAIANEAAVAIENFGLIEKIKKETLVRDRLQRYLSPDVAEQVISGGESIELGGARRNVTILFGDIRKFTALSEKLPAREIVNSLNELYTILTDVIFKYGGMLDKFIGDALMAVFGAPVKYDDHALKAVRCAIAMQEKIKEFNDRRKCEGKVCLEMGIGINTGDCIIGNMGSLKRMDYTAIGDTVNTASRIVVLSPGGEIYINETTNGIVGGDVNTERLEPVMVKGKKEPLNLFRICGIV